MASWGGHHCLDYASFLKHFSAELNRTETVVYAKPDFKIQDLGIDGKALVRSAKSVSAAVVLARPDFNNGGASRQWPDSATAATQRKRGAGVSAPQDFHRCVWS